LQSPADLRQGHAKSIAERGLVDEAVDAENGGGAKHDTVQQRELTISLDKFAWSAITEEARRLGISTEELARFSVLYYLADLDSGRIARRLPSTVRC
jgi:hypothetical protein